MGSKAGDFMTGQTIVIDGGAYDQLIPTVIPGRAKREPGISRFRVQPWRAAPE